MNGNWWATRRTDLAGLLFLVWLIAVADARHDRRARAGQLRMD